MEEGSALFEDGSWQRPPAIHTGLDGGEPQHSEKSDAHLDAGGHFMPCCVYFAPWFEIGRPGWNLEVGCTHTVHVTDLAEPPILYTMEGVTIRPGSDATFVCDACSHSSQLAAQVAAAALRPPVDATTIVVDPDDDDDGLVPEEEEAPSEDGASVAASHHSTKSRHSSVGGSAVPAELEPLTIPSPHAASAASMGLASPTAGGARGWAGTPRAVIESRLNSRVEQLEHRLAEREAQLVYIRKVYHKDVFVLREHMFRAGQQGSMWEPTFRTDMPSSVELNELLRLFNPGAQLQVMETTEVELLKEDHRALGELRAKFDTLQQKAAALVLRHQQLSDSAKSVALRADQAEADKLFLQSTLTTLSGKLDVATNRIKDLEAQLLAKSQEIVQVRTANVGLQTQVSNAEMEVQTLTEALETANQDLERLQELEEQLEAARIEIERQRILLDEAALVARERDLLRSQMIDRNSTIETQRQTIDRLNGVIADVNNQLRLTQLEAETAKAQAGERIGALQGEIANHQQTIAELQSELAETKFKLKETENELDRETQNGQALASQLSALQTEANNLQVHIYECNATIADLQESVKAAREINIEQNIKIQDLQQELREAQLQILDLRTYQVLSEKLQANLHHMTERLVQSQDDYTALSNRFTAVHDELQRMLAMADSSSISDAGDDAFADIDDEEAFSPGTSAGTGSPTHGSPRPGSARLGDSPAGNMFRASSAPELQRGHSPRASPHHRTPTHAASMGGHSEALGESVPLNLTELAIAEPPERSPKPQVKFGSLFAVMRSTVKQNKKFRDELAEVKAQLAAEHASFVNGLHETIASLQRRENELLERIQALQRDVVDRDGIIADKNQELAAWLLREMEWNRLHRHLIDQLEMMWEDNTTNQVLLRETRRSLKKSATEVDIIRSAYRTLEFTSGARQEELQGLVDKYARESEEWKHSCDIYRRKFYDLLDKETKEAQPLRDTGVQARFEGQDNSCQTDLWDGLRRPAVTMSRVDLTLPQGTYYYVPPTSRPPSRMDRPLSPPRSSNSRSTSPAATSPTKRSASPTQFAGTPTSAIARMTPLSLSTANLPSSSTSPLPSSRRSYVLPPATMSKGGVRPQSAQPKLEHAGNLLTVHLPRPLSATSQADAVMNHVYLSPASTPGGSPVPQDGPLILDTADLELPLGKPVLGTGLPPSGPVPVTPKFPKYQTVHDAPTLIAPAHVITDVHQRTTPAVKVPMHMRKRQAHPMLRAVTKSASTSTL